MSPRILVIGRTGQVAQELGRGRWPAGVVVDFIEPPEIDLACPNEASDRRQCRRLHGSGCGLIARRRGLRAQPRRAGGTGRSLSRHRRGADP